MAGQFVDVSSFQGNIDWQAYAAWSRQGDGIARVAIKATEGIGFTDPQFSENRAGALNAGVGQILYYHFARPDLGNSASAEASWMTSVIGSIRSNDLIVLDYEVEDVRATADWALAWLIQMQGQYAGRNLVGIYASPYYIGQHLQNPALANFPLWLANWTYDPSARPSAPSPWVNYQALQYTDRATIPGIPTVVDADIFISGGIMNTYSQNSSDFNTYFTVDANGNWVCKAYNNPVIMGGNKALFSSISIDGNTLPIIGLPRTSELYQQESDGYAWSVQFFERGVIVYDPSHRQDSQPGFGASYLGKYLQFAHLDPAYQPPVTNQIPAAVVTDIKAVEAAEQQLLKDANIG